MKNTLTTGLRYTRRIKVERDATIGFMGEQMRVYATPSMVHDVEYACRDLLMQHCESNEDSVGSHIEMDHLAPTLLGMWVEVAVRISELDGPRVTFDVEVRDAIEQVGRGRHVRFVIDTERQLARLQKKAAKAGSGA